MTKGLDELRPGDLDADLLSVIVPTLVETLRNREPGHCLRVNDLDRHLVLSLCRRLRQEVPQAQTLVLGESNTAEEADLFVTSTKLVELRNPDADGKLRPPLLVFVLPGGRFSAEDSFGVATFEEVRLGDVHEQLARTLFERLPSELRGHIREVLNYLAEQRWAWSGSVARARYLRTILKNGPDAEAAGAALYELGLAPDFKLLDEAAGVLTRLSRNRSCVERLTRADRGERGRVLDLRLESADLRARLASFLGEHGADDPRRWGRRIVAEPENWALSFDKWTFARGQELPKVCVEIVSTGLPTVSPERADDAVLGSLVGQQYLPLGPAGTKSFEVNFRVNPHPAQIPGLDHFEVQILSQDEGPVANGRKTKKTWKTKTGQTKVSFKPQHMELSEGWHYIRVRAMTEDVDPLPLVDRNGVAVPPPGTQDEAGAPRRANESDLFYVVPEADAEGVETDRPAALFPTLEHARIELALEAVGQGQPAEEVIPTAVTWASPAKGRRRAAAPRVEVRFAGAGLIHVPVTPLLSQVEQKLAQEAGQAACVRVAVRNGQADPPSLEPLKLSDSAAAEAMLTAREACLKALRGEGELPLVAADLPAHEAEIVEYAGRYQELVRGLLERVQAESGAAQAQALAELGQALRLDSVFLLLHGRGKSSRQAVLLGPTHPLRLVWLAAWARLGRAWTTRLGQAAAEERNRSLPAVRAALVEEMAPLNFPTVVPAPGGQLFTAVDNVHPYWSLYAPTREEDPRGLLAEVCAVLKLPEPVRTARLGGKYLAGRVMRYLAQHPYVRTLTLNVFNPGSAALVADLLRHLQSQNHLAGLRYDVRLFARDTSAPELGEALREFLAPGAGGKAAEVFAAPSGDHLAPKLALAVRPLAEFTRQPGHFPAHISLLFDVFPPEEVGVALQPLGSLAGTVHGLFQNFRTGFCEDDDGVRWERQPVHGPVTPLPDDGELARLLASLPELLSEAAATVATGRHLTGAAPVITLTLRPRERAFLTEVHTISDWVFSLDRNLGIEFFDHPRRPDRPDYLIDHSPEMVSPLGHRLVITSSSLAELAAIFGPVLAEYGLPAEGGHAVGMLDQLRSLSGRLALKLASSPTQRAEALGLALARIYLGYQGAFRNQLVVPLDAHLELYAQRDREAASPAGEVSFKRTDLALFDLDPTSRVITCSLVEVKCMRHVGEASAWRALRENIQKQIEQSELVLREHFDPTLTQPDRPDRALKTRQLAGLLEFYLDRSQRYRQIDPAAAEQARAFLGSLDDGYQLRFRRSAIVFDFDHPGSGPADPEGGVEYHRIGFDLARGLVAMVGTATEPSDSGPSEETPDVPRDEGPRPPATPPAPPVPVLTEAAFLAPTRSWPTSDEIPPGTAPGGEEVARGPAEKHDVGVPEGHGSRPRGSAAAGSAAIEAPPSGHPASAPVSAPAAATRAGEAGTVACDVLLGATESSPQYGLLGDVGGRKVGIDLNQTHTISLFGVQGGGKSYTLGTLVEMACLSIPGINRLPHPLAAVIFHYSATQDYKPEFTSMVEANNDESQVRVLAERYGARPQPLRDVVLLAPRDKVALRQAEYPGLTVVPLVFAPSELQAGHWRFLMGAVGSHSLYMRQINALMQSLGSRISLTALREGIERSKLSEHLRQLANARLDLAEQYIEEGVTLGRVVRPGRLVIVDLRSEYIEKDVALGLFVVLLQLFADAKHEGGSFNKLIVFDEAHKYMENQQLVSGLIEVVREMRHKGASVLVASQDPPSVPVQLIELATQVILHRFNSPAWLKHVQRANAALGGLTAEKMAQVGRGEAYIWSSVSTEGSFSAGAVKVRCRPRVTRHGGETRTAAG
jgi:DNA phosphorothioation-dependent restriction protein DptH